MLNDKLIINSFNISSEYELSTNLINVFQLVTHSNYFSLLSPGSVSTKSDK